MRIILILVFLPFLIYSEDLLANQPGYHQQGMEPQKTAPFLHSAASSVQPSLVPQLGHYSFITGVAISSDGGLALTGSEDGTARLWDRGSGKLLRIFATAGGAINDVALSPNKRWILTAHEDKIARLWDAATGKMLRRFEGHSDDVHAVDFSPDGRFAVTGSADESVRLWEVANGKELRIFRGHNETVKFVALSSKGRLILSGSTDGTARLWDATTGRELQQFGKQLIVTNRWTSKYNEFGDKISTGYKPPPVAFSPDGRYAVIAKLYIKAGRSPVPYKLDIWDLSSIPPSFMGSLEHKSHSESLEDDLVIGDGSRIRTVTFSPDGRFLAVGGEFGIRIWDFDKQKLIHEFTELKPRDIAISQDSRFLLAGGGIYNVWAGILDVKYRKEPIQWLEGGAGPVRTVAFSPDGRHLVTGLQDSTARLWDLGSGKALHRFKGHVGLVNSAKFFPDGRHLATGGRAGTLRVWDVASGVEKQFFRVKFEDNRTNWLWDADLSPDGQRAVIGSMGRVFLWDVSKGEVIKTVEPAKGEVDVWDAKFSADGSQVFIGTKFELDIWDLSAGKLLPGFRSYPEGIESLAVSPKGRFIAVGLDNGDAVLLDVIDKKAIRRFKGHQEVVRDLAFSPNGLWLVTGSNDGTARVWEVSTAKQVYQFNGHWGPVRSVDFSPSGQLIVTGGDDGTARLWQVAKGKELCRLVSSLDASWIVISPDGRFDTNNLGNVPGLHWVLPDDPFKPLALELFMQEFYEPRLLPKLLAGDPLPAIRDILTLNRAQPKVEITRLESVREQSGMSVVEVEVQVQNVTQTFLGRESPILKDSGVHGLRLFRDGYLVAQWGGTDKKPFLAPEAGRQRKLEAWRRATQIKLDPTGKAKKKFALGIPRRTGRNQVIAVSTNGNIMSWEASTGVPVHTFSPPGATLNASAISLDGRFVFSASSDGVMKVWDTMAITEHHTLKRRRGNISAATFLTGGTLLTASQDGTIRSWNVETGAEIDHMEYPGIEVFGNGPGFGWNITSHADGIVRIWNWDRRPYDEQKYHLVGHSGSVRSIFYAPNEPYVVTGSDDESARLWDLAGLNTKFFDRRHKAVEVRRFIGHTEAITAVAMSPDGRYVLTGSEDKSVRLWNRASGAQVRQYAGITGKVKNVAFSLEYTETEFSAYAFNKDRVKSPTVTRSINISPFELKPVKRKAYVITVGVGDNEALPWRLAFASDDAEITRDTLTKYLKQSNQFDKVVAIPLITNHSNPDFEADQADFNDRPPPILPTEENIRTVFGWLLGKREDSKRLFEFPDQYKTIIQKVRPEDLVIISFSTHGITDKHGEFYLLPYDLGRDSGKQVTNKLLSRAISSQELALWLGEMESEQMVLIIDACYAAAVEGKGFKPGPMGSRGLGQLAYDKQMPVLTATQAKDSAWARGYSLLTYALVKEGIEQGKAVQDGRFTLQDILRYAERRVPKLYQEVVPDNQTAGPQKPKLFDFIKRRGYIHKELVLTRKE